MGVESCRRASQTPSLLVCTHKVGQLKGIAAVLLAYWHTGSIIQNVYGEKQINLCLPQFFIHDLVDLRLNQDIRLNKRLGNDLANENRGASIRYITLP